MFSRVSLQLYETHPLLSAQNIISCLQPLLPLSLTILGPLIQSIGAGVSQFRLWSTFPLQEPTGGSIQQTGSPPFAFFLWNSDKLQARFFCSAEITPGSATKEEEAFVFEIFEKALNIVYHLLDKEGGQLAALSDVTVRNVHEKWLPCLRLLPTNIRKSRTFLRPRELPAATEATTEDANDQPSPPVWPGLGFSPLTEDDLDVVVPNPEHVQRRAHVVTKLSSSMCVRPYSSPKGSAPIPQVSAPVAWTWIHWDGSIGALHVKPSFRRRGLASALVEYIAERRVGGTLGWHWVDVMESNVSANGLFQNLYGWEEGWPCAWMTFRKELDVKVEEISSTAFPTLRKLLSFYMPTSLTVLGPLDMQSPEDLRSEASLRIWSTFPILPDTTEAPHIFVLFLCTTKHKDRRFFCSSESSPSSATLEEMAFVRGALRAFTKCANASIAAEYGEFALHSSIEIGNIHEKWSVCLQPLASQSWALHKFIWSVPSTQPTIFLGNSQSLPSGYSCEPLFPDDVDVLIASDYVHPRSRAQLISALSHSMCIRVPASAISADQHDAFTDGWGEFADAEAPDDGPDAQVPIAWALRSWDGSVISLQVDPDFRRRGLATLVLQRLAATSHLRVRQAPAADVQSPDPSYQIQCWNWLDVQEANSGALAFYRSLADWQEGWRCHWMTFLPQQWA